MDSDGEENALIKASLDCDLPALRRAIAAGEDVNQRDDQGFTALHHLCAEWRDNILNEALARTRVACVLELIDAGADVNMRDRHDKYPSPPLTDAVRLGIPEVVSALINAGADVNMGLPEDSSAPGLTPLHTAAIFGCAESVRLLLAAGADVDAVSHGGVFYHGMQTEESQETPLDAAIRERSLGDAAEDAPSESDATRTFAHLLRAGARIPTHPRFPSPPYLSAVAAAGGYARYERAHCERLAEIFMPKPDTGKGRRRSKRRRSPLHSLPAEVIHHIVSIWADVGGH